MSSFHLANHVQEGATSYRLFVHGLAEARPLIAGLLSGSRPVPRFSAMVWS